MRTQANRSQEALINQIPLLGDYFDIYICRHGDVPWVATAEEDKRARRMGLYGVDPPLSNLGRMNAVALGRTLKEAGVRAVFKGDSRRVHQTAQIVTGEIGISARRWRYLNGLWEVTAGELEAQQRVGERFGFD